MEDEEGETIDNLRKALEDDRQLVKDGIMTEDEFQQEWYNSFEAAIKGAVYLKEISDARKNNRIVKTLYDATLPVYTVWDLGVSKSDAMAIGFFQRVGKEVRLIDYYESTGLGLPHYIKMVKEKRYVYGKHFAPHDIMHKELTTGKTRLETAKKLGIDFEVVPKLSIDDGIDLARAMWARLWVCETTCELFLDLIGQYHFEFDEKHGRLSKVPVHDFSSHAADMLRGAAVIEDEMLKDEIAADDEPVDANPDDEYIGHEDLEERKEGYGKHPLLKDVRIGELGHKKPK